MVIELDYISYQLYLYYNTLSDKDRKVDDNKLNLICFSYHYIQPLHVDITSF